MASRHTRRKRAAERKERILVGMAQAERGKQVAEIVRRNLASPIERNYYARIKSSVQMCVEQGLPSSDKEGKRLARYENPTISRQQAKKFKRK